jgi:2-polyprenyl-6-methoxyphenol hydroxylase-like FAD-dependent oxidoreductase
MSKQTDVVVVGAGPVGLLAAVELRLAGASVVVLERLEAPSTVTKALGMGPLGSEALQRRGMNAAMAAAEERTLAEIKTFIKQSAQGTPGRGSKLGGHFAGLKLIRTDAQKEPERRARLVDQHAVEAMLAERARTFGIEVRRDCTVTRVEQQTNGVEVGCASVAGEDPIRCSYLVGCDGGRSAIRKMAGFDFPGTDPTLTMYTAVVEIDHPERLASSAWQHTSTGMFTYGPFPGRIFLLDFSGPPKDREAPVTREEVESVLRRISAADVRVTALESGSRWTDNTRLVDTYRKGRVLLAGDAAHIHSPFGGQGMSLGLVDAANVGWKLAAVIRGEMPESLLDTYTAERRPVAEAVLENTLAQAAIMRPDPQAAAMRALVAKMLDFDDVNQYFGGMMSGLATRYELGPASIRDEVGRLIADRPVSRLAGGGTLYDLMQNGMGVLLDATSDGRASKLVAATAQRVCCVGVDSGPSLLIRPDACIAWAGDEDSTNGLVEALGRWFVSASPMLDRFE